VLAAESREVHPWLILSPKKQSGSVRIGFEEKAKHESMTVKEALAALANGIRRLAAGPGDAPDVQVEDYVLEHFLLYNGLSGSTPENQPDYREVRNEIVQAINDGSAQQLAIALKLPPLRWQERLERIFAEIALVNRDVAINCLAAGCPDDITGDTACLSHGDWQVRANAACLLAFLEAKQSVPALIELLHQSSGRTDPDFCHVAGALSRLGGEDARRALLEHLHDSEPWFCVDAAAAISCWELPSVAAELMNAMLSGNLLDDYMAVAISRNHRVIDFTGFQEDCVQEGVCELVLSLLKSLRGVFHSEAGLDQQLEEVQTRINEMAQAVPTPRRLAAAVALNLWIDSRTPGCLPEQKGCLIRDLSDGGHYESVKQAIVQFDPVADANSGQFRHALALSAQFKLSELSPLLIPLLSPGAPALKDLLDCLAALGDSSAAPVIAELIEKTVEIERRSALPFEKYPVPEPDRAAAELYWSALKALGALPDRSSLNILRRAVNDHAPDIREQALMSLAGVLLSDDLKKHYGSANLEKLLRKRSSDPASGVQAAALAGVSLHRLGALVPEVLKALHSRERQIQRRALDTLLILCRSGCETDVRLGLEAGIRKELDPSKKALLKETWKRIQESSRAV
jgi:HEAT repeat protein